MTRYKKYLKEKYHIKFDEDLPYLPFNVDSFIVLETRYCFIIDKGIVVTSIYNVDLSNTLYKPNGEIEYFYYIDR